LAGHQSVVTSAAFSPDSSKVVSGGLDRLVTASLGGFAIGFANAFVGAMRPTLILPIAVIVAAAILALAVRPRRLSPAVAAAPEAEVALAGGA
jgi:hypothetical protein